MTTSTQIRMLNPEFVQVSGVNLTDNQGNVLLTGEFRGTMQIKDTLQTLKAFTEKRLTIQQFQNLFGTFFSTQWPKALAGHHPGDMLHARWLLCPLLQDDTSELGNRLRGY